NFLHVWIDFSRFWGNCSQPWNKRPTKPTRPSPSWNNRCPVGRSSTWPRRNFLNRSAPIGVEQVQRVNPMLTISRFVLVFPLANQDRCPEVSPVELILNPLGTGDTQFSLILSRECHLGQLHQTSLDAVRKQNLLRLMF